MLSENSKISRILTEIGKNKSSQKSQNYNFSFASMKCGHFKSIHMKNTGSVIYFEMNNYLENSDVNTFTNVQYLKVRWEPSMAILSIYPKLSTLVCNDYRSTATSTFALRGIAESRSRLILKRPEDIFPFC